MQHRVAIAAAVILSFTGLVGCGDDSTNNSHDMDAAVRTIPADNATGHDPASPIYMMFNDQMDTVGFHNMAYCIDSTAHRGLQDSLMGHMFGMMNPGQDSMMYYQRMHERRITGQFHWNSDRDSCAFVPDEAMMDHTRYYLHFRETMRDHEGHRMQHMGSMMDQDMMQSFRTQ